MAKRDLKTVTDFNHDELQEIFYLTAKMKDNPGDFIDSLPGKTMVMINEKQSLRTKVTFETGIQQLGGHSVYLTNLDINLGKREPVKDIARNLSRWVDIIVARVFSQTTILELSEFSTIPVVNALSDEGHPCQVIADMFTIWDQVRGREDLVGYNMTYIGDGNNVCNSLILISGLVGLDLTVCTPPGYEPDPRFIRMGRQLTHENGGSITFETNPQKAVSEADAVYTDVWTSMGQEAESQTRLDKFQGYQVNDDLLSSAPGHCAVMHCLPAHRNEEITESALENERSLVFDQAENRLHGQKAIMYFLMKHSELEIAKKSLV